MTIWYTNNDSGSASSLTNASGWFNSQSNPIASGDVGKSVKEVTISLKMRQSTIASGISTLNTVVWDSSGNVRSTSAGVDVSTLGTSFADVVFTHTPAPSIQSGDYVGVTVTGMTSTTNYPQAELEATASLGKWQYSSGSWSSNNMQEIHMLIDDDESSGGGSSGGGGGGSSGGGDGGTPDDANSTGMYEPPIQIFRRMNF